MSYTAQPIPCLSCSAWFTPSDGHEFFCTSCEAKLSRQEKRRMMNVVFKVKRAIGKEGETPHA